MTSRARRSDDLDEPGRTETAMVALLVKRARIALWMVIASNAFFAITDLRLSRDAMALVLGLKLAQVGTVTVGLWALRWAHTRRAVIAIVLAAAALIAGLTALSGAVAGEIVTTMILWIGVPFGTTTLLPWGARSQLALGVISGLAMLLNVYLARGTLAPALEFSSVGVVVTLAVSVALAHEFERQRRVLAEENLRRAHAEAMLRQANDTLDQRVRERTNELEAANARLQEARDLAQAAEHRFRTVSNLTSDYAYCFRVEADFRAVIEWLTEPSFERLTGYTTAEVAQMGGGLALIHPEDQAIAVRRLESLLTGHADVSEFRIIRRDGSVCWIREHGYPEWDATQARVVRIFGAAQDVTDRRAAEEQLAEALRQRENVMNTVPDIIYSLDCEGRMQDWNRRLEIVSGRSAAAIAGVSALELFVPTDRARVAAAIQEALATGYARVEADLLVPGGVRPYHFSGVPLRSESGAVVGLTGVGRDVFELKQLQERTATLLDVARDISGRLDLDAILEQVQLRTADVLQCDMVATFYWDAEREGFRAVSHHGVPTPLKAVLDELTFPLDAPFGGRLRAGETVVLDDARQLGRIGPLLPASALIAAPLRVRGRHLGALVTLKVGPQQFDTAQVALCEGIAAQLAVALEAAELYQAQREEARVSGALARVGQELISSLDTPGLLDQLCRLTAEALDCDGSVALLLQPGSQMHVVEASHGFSDAQRESLQLLRLPHSAVAGLLDALDRQHVVQIDMASAPTRWAALPAQFGCTTALYVPLRRGCETIGILGAVFRGRRMPATTLPWKRIGRGISQLASFALEHARATEALAEASRLKSEFLATISHELRTPLNIMLGYNEMLLHGAAGPLLVDQLEILRRSDNSARELLQLITDTLDLSRLEVGRVALIYTEVSVADLVREIEEETRGLRQKPSVRVEWRVAQNLPQLHTDRGKLKVVIKNLFANALKFTDEGVVTLCVSASGKQLEIRVDDTGIGIAPSALGYIFEPFRQADSSMTRRHGGVGLGLYIVRRLLDLLGGSIEVTSEVDVGTSFRVRMPLGTAEETIAA